MVSVPTIAGVAPPKQSPPALYDQFLLFGDSITQMASSQDRGWTLSPALEDAYIRRLDIVNRGFSGYNTDQALRVLPRFMPAPEHVKIRIMTVFFGANDACLPDTNQHVPLDRYIRQLRQILTHPKVEAHNLRLVLITPPPICEHKLDEGPVLRRRAVVTKSYADGARKVAEELGVPVLDMWSLCMAKTGWKEGQPLPGSLDQPRSKALDELLFDGLHPGPAGYRILFDGLMQLIAKKWPDQLPDRLQPALPDWDDVAAWETWSD